MASPPQVKGEKMNEYKRPEIELILLNEKSIITTSPGTETTPKDDGDGSWEIKWW